MAPNSTVRMTPLAALLDAVLRAQRDVGLPTYLALARAPGASWMTFDEIVADLTALTGRKLNRVSLKTYAEKDFGIPDTRYITVDGREVSMPKPVGVEIAENYLRALDYTGNGIDPAVVRGETMTQAVRHESAQRVAAESSADVDGNEA